MAAPYQSLSLLCEQYDLAPGEAISQGAPTRAPVHGLRPVVCPKPTLDTQEFINRHLASCEAFEDGSSSDSLDEFSLAPGEPRSQSPPRGYFERGSPQLPACPPPSIDRQEFRARLVTTNEDGSSMDDLEEGRSLASGEARSQSPSRGSQFSWCPPPTINAHGFSAGHVISDEDGSSMDSLEKVSLASGKARSQSPFRARYPEHRGSQLSPCPSPRLDPRVQHLTFCEDGEPCSPSSDTELRGDHAGIDGMWRAEDSLGACELSHDGTTHSPNRQKFQNLGKLYPPSPNIEESEGKRVIPENLWVEDSLSCWEWGSSGARKETREEPLQDPQCLPPPADLKAPGPCNDDGSQKGSQVKPASFVDTLLPPSSVTLSGKRKRSLTSLLRGDAPQSPLKEVKSDDYRDLPRLKPRTLNDNASRPPSANPTGGKRSPLMSTRGGGRRLPFKELNLDFWPSFRSGLSLTPSAEITGWSSSVGEQKLVSSSRGKKGRFAELPEDRDVVSLASEPPERLRAEAPTSSTSPAASVDDEQENCLFQTASPKRWVPVHLKRAQALKAQSFDVHEPGTRCTAPSVDQSKNSGRRHSMDASEATTIWSEDHPQDFEVPMIPDNRAAALPTNPECAYRTAHTLDDCKPETSPLTTPGRKSGSVAQAKAKRPTVLEGYLGFHQKVKVEDTTCPYKDQEDWRNPRAGRKFVVPSKQISLDRWIA